MTGHDSEFRASGPAASTLDAFWTPARYNTCMSHSRRRSEEVFVVRIWVESPQVNVPQWRASVTHLGTGRRRYFTSYAELCEFLEAMRRDP